ncbi:MAG: LEA type 2 family protein [Gemmatimonadaceae bacterium]|nr:LEA type 2 family protein [Gemmatimonadaceae bacterium]
MRLKFALIAAAALVSASCAGLGRGGFKDPIVTFKNVQVGGIGLTGGTLDVILSVYNPNGYRLDASRVTYKVMVDSLDVGAGALDKHFMVQSNDSTEVVLPLHFNWNGLNAAGRELMKTGSIPYRVLGDLTVGSGVGDFTIQYDRTGNFNSLSGVR